LEDYLKAVPALQISEVAEVKHELALKQNDHRVDLQSLRQ
jgi:hypothetical protein